jgi:DnaK suppressor protein
MPRKKKTEKVELEEIRDLLLEKRQDILRGSIEHQLGTEEQIRGDLVDQSTDQFERELRLGLVEGDREKLRQIDAALEMIDKNEYGKCEECNQPIPVKRLIAMPTARTCVECQQKLERMGYSTRKD